MRNLLLVAGGLLIGLAIAEAGLRVLYPTYPAVYEPDPVLLYRLVPSSRKIFVREPANGGQRIPVMIDRDGFRGEELRPRSRATRVAVYGDSFIEAEFSTLDSTFAKRLEQDLGGGKDTIEVVNAGVVGYGPDQELFAIRQGMERLEPDIVVLAVYAGNDMGDLLRHKMFRLAPDGSLLVNNYHLNPRIDRLLRKAASPGSMWQSSLYRLVQRVMERRSARPVSCRFGPLARANGVEPLEETLQVADSEYRAYLEDSTHEVRNIFCGHYDADVALTPDAPSARYKAALAEALVGEIERTVEARGARFVLLIIPSPVDVCDGYEISVDRTKFPAYVPSHLTDVFERMARRRGMPHLNLYRPFRATDGCRLYFRHRDDHWNDEGQRLAALLTADFLRNQAPDLIARGESAPAWFATRGPAPSRSLPADRPGW